jgi:cell division protein FtsB
MAKLFSRKPYLTTLVAIGALCFFELMIFARAVLAQTPILILAEETGFSATMQIIQLASVVITFIGFAAGFVWYIVKGKSSEQQAATIKQLETSNADLRATNSELRLEKAELNAEVKDLEHENETLRKKNLRLQGLDDR